MLNLAFVRLLGMRYVLLILTFFYLHPSSAQSFSYPKMPASGRSIENIVPTHWHAIDTIYGDLNNDQREDLVLVLEFNEPINEPRAYGDADTEIIKEFQRPRMMVVYFKQTNRQYIFALQNNHFILREKEGGIYGDPYQGIAIYKNSLNLNFSGGSSWQWQLNYQFKYRQRDWVLVAATNRYFQRSTGELAEKDYDFLNNKVKETKGNLNAENEQTVTSANLPTNGLRTFTSFKKPWTWEITKDNFL